MLIFWAFCNYLALDIVYRELASHILFPECSVASRLRTKLEISMLYIRICVVENAAMEAVWKER